MPNRTSSELSEGSLGRVEVTRETVTRSNVHNQPEGLSFLKLLAPPAQFPYNSPPSQAISHPAYCRRKDLILGFHWFIRCHQLTPEDGSLFSQVVSHSQLAFFLLFDVLKATTCGNQKPSPRLISTLQQFQPLRATIRSTVVTGFRRKGRFGMANLMRPI